MIEETDKYARRCDITGKGMNEGYVIVDGFKYIHTKEDFIAHLKTLKWIDADGNDVHEQGYNDFSLMEYFYAEGYYCWTEWYEVEDDYYFTEDGELIEIN